MEYLSNVHTCFLIDEDPLTAFSCSGARGCEKTSWSEENSSLKVGKYINGSTLFKMFLCLLQIIFRQEATSTDYFVRPYVCLYIRAWLSWLSAYSSTDHLYIKLEYKMILHILRLTFLPGLRGLEIVDNASSAQPGGDLGAENSGSKNSTLTSWNTTLKPNYVVSSGLYNITKFKK